jgi:hypothetical protein
MNGKPANENANDPPFHDLERLFEIVRDLCMVRGRDFEAYIADMGRMSLAQANANAGVHPEEGDDVFGIHPE